MNACYQVLIAGFGGQGVLACGQILALAAMIALAATYYHPALEDARAGKRDAEYRKRGKT